MFAAFGLNAQETDPDSTSTGYKLGQLELYPGSIVGKYTYDPILDRYVYNETVGDIPISFPLFLTPEEYQKLVLEEQMREYFKQKSDAMAGKAGSEEAQKNLLPIFYVNSSFFQSIFGGDQIEVIPQGSVEMDLGVLYTKSDNPSLSPRNRSSFTFDFDQRISLSLLGKIGTRLQVTANYDTESTFDFQNQIKLEYTPNEDDILQKIEVGNVSMPLNSALIQGAQSLFGAKVQLKFGKTTITGVYAEQNSERQTVQIQGGGAIQDFEKFILEYDEDRHFFLAHYFRDHYNEALQNYPFINSNVQITRIEVWVTNRSNNTEALISARNIVAVQDLGESDPENVGILLDESGNPDPNPQFSGFLNVPSGSYPDNSNNDFNPFGITGPEQSVLTPAIRDVASVQQGFGTYSDDVGEGVDYVKLENAKQLLPSEYTLYPQLGYISLNQRLTNDEILAVAFQYTVNGKVYQVGEFANDGIQATETSPDPSNPGDEVVQNQNLVVKMLKSSITNVNEPVWDIMMKNIYGLDAYQLEREDFRLKILYTDPQPLNYIKPAEGASVPLPEDVANTNLLRVFSLDNLNRNNDPIAGGDGFFDYVPGITIDPENGRVIFTTVEPFGRYLFNKLDPDPNAGTEDYDNPTTYNANQEKYVFRALYETTKVQAQQESAEKNKFQLKGSYKSSGQGGIPIGAFNVPRGSVTVTAGGRVLQEGVDYTVDYQLGRVKILDDALLASNVPIQVSTENNALFGQQTKRFTGVHVEHKFNENFLIGATYLNLNERPVTQKANYSYEPINNSIYGFNINYSTEVPFLTRLVNKLPNIDTDVVSNFSLRGEFAYLQPGAPKGTDFNGVATTYIDDFEASQTSISVMSPMSWELSSVPVGFRGPNDTNENFDVNNDLSINDYRAEMAWYTIDPIFYSNQRPNGVSDEDLSSYATRRVFVNEIFPNTDIAQGQTQAIYTLDLAYSPSQRGPYNYNQMATGTGTLPNPEDNFGGIVREMTTTNFERANVEFVEFWIMDPFIYDENADVEDGTIVFNFGSITEDVLKDGRKQYENGLPPDGGTENTLITNFAKIPANQSLIYAFDTEGQERINQDVGYDGFDDADEAANFPAFAGFEDPSNDNYTYYLNTDGSIVERYRNYNGSQGNSPTEVTQTNRGNSAYPTVEDVNRDNTMNTIDSYFQYEVPIFRNMGVNNNTSTQPGIDEDYITDVKQVTVTMQDGQQLPVRWIQFKVPLRRDSEYSVGGISDLRSIRFMRLFLTDFEEEIVLRFGTMDLVRGDYRRYTEAIVPNGSDPETNVSTILEVAAVSEEETSDYIPPPGVVREEFINNNEAIREDEQSMSLTVKNLEPGDSRAVYKNFQVDMRQYKNLEMFLHAEALPQPNIQLQDNELVAFIRMGTDFSENFYQIEIPLVTSPENASTARQVWPAANELKVPLELLQQIKSLVIGNSSFSSSDLNFFTSNLQPSPNNVPGQLRVGIKGNPSFGDVRVIMLGLKNAGDTDVSGEVWFNELRLSDLKNQGGWATILNVDTNLADFATISATGRKSTIGFGSIEQGPNARSREDIQQYDVVTSLNLGQLLPPKWGIKIPFNYSRGEKLITPQYDPEFLDIELETLLDNTESEAQREIYEERAQDYTKRQSVSVIGLRKDRTGDAKPMPYDIENFTFSGTYNQIDHRDFEIKESLDQNVNVGATYNFNFNPVVIEPLKNVAFLDSTEYFNLFQDFNVNLLPTNLTASSNIIRQYNEQQFREINRNPGDIGLPTLYQRNFLFNWQYGINYNLTESLSFNFNSSNNRIVRNYINEQNVPNPEIGIWDGFFDIGQPDQHYQTLQLNYDLPFQKIPILEFVRAQYTYTGNFQWQKGSEILNDLEGIPNIGNSVQNSSTHQINGTLELSTLYNEIGLTKRQAQKSNLGGGVRRDARNPGGETDSKSALSLAKQQTTDESGTSGLDAGDKAYNTFVGILTAIERVQIDYQETQGTFLPGYTRGVGFSGTLKPTVGFTFGLQDDVRAEAAGNGWLTLYQEFNQQYLETESRQLNLQASLDLLPGLTIDLNANKTYMETYSENYRVDVGDLEYHSLTPSAFGNFNISTILIGTAFNSSNEESSETFQQFRENRLAIANRLATEAGINLSDPSNINQETGFPIGFGRNSQSVLLPAFLAAYSGKDANDVKLGAFRDVPLPNWNIKYTGLMRLDWFKNTFNRFSLEHGYSAGYTINRFQSNLEYDRIAPYSSSNTDQSGNYRGELLFSNINLVEQFSPLVKIDFEMKNSVQVLMQVDKDRLLTMSFDNNLLTEIQGNEYTLGLGYRIKDLKIATTIAGNRRILSSDLNFKLDASFRKNRTIIRYLDVDNNQTTAGQDIWTINFTVDYALTKNLTALFYYDHSFSEYAISTAFPQTTIRSGITLRYNFGN
ncbi:MAG TPA: cell surface protein SprA [Flavobacteriaceae bacterium]|nr:cell surface protein SprA [Flavobacteriaceae bacterium]